MLCFKVLIGHFICVDVRKEETSFTAAMQIIIVVKAKQTNKTHDTAIQFLGTYRKDCKSHSTDLLASHPYAFTIHNTEEKGPIQISIYRKMDFEFEKEQGEVNGRILGGSEGNYITRISK